MISEAADMCKTEVFLSDKGVTCQISPTVTSNTTYNGFYKYLDIPLVKITIGLAYYYHWKEVSCTADREILHFTPCEKNRIHHGWSVEIGKSQPKGPSVPVGNEARLVSHWNDGPEG